MTFSLIGPPKKIKSLKIIVIRILRKRFPKLVKVETVYTNTEKNGGFKIASKVPGDTNKRK